MKAFNPKFPMAPDEYERARSSHIRNQIIVVGARQKKKNRSTLETKKSHNVNDGLSPIVIGIFCGFIVGVLAGYVIGNSLNSAIGLQ